MTARTDEPRLLRGLLEALAHYPEEVPAEDILRTAGRWLDENPNHINKPAVMGRLLRTWWMPQYAWAGLALRALDLIESRRIGEDDDYLIASLLPRITSLPPELLKRWTDCASAWISVSTRQNEVLGLFRFLKRHFNDEVPAWIRHRLDENFIGRFRTPSSFDWDSPSDFH
jgi:hypothetical protein